MELRDVPVPEPGPGQVRVKVHVAGVNYADLAQRLGRYPGGPKPPYAAGFEVAGEVDAVGSNVHGWKAGAAVMGFCEGGYSDYALVDAASLLPKPDRLDFQHAAAAPCQYLTAYHALITLGRLSDGQTVLVHAAAGGLGTIMVQIARNIGATVIGTCSSAEKCALLREIGCHHVVDYIQDDFEKEARSVTEGRGCDLIIESVGGNVFTKSLRVLKPRGHLIALGLASGQLRSVDVISLLVRNHTVSGFHLMGYASDVAATARAMQDLQRWLEENRLRFIVKHVFSLEEAAEAHRMIAERKTVGKVVLQVTP